MPDNENFKTLAIDLEDAHYWLTKDASLKAIELSTDSKWVTDNSASGWAVWLVGLNPVKGFYNLARHGQYTSETSGAVEVSTDQRRCEKLRSEIILDFENAFFREAAKGPEEVHQFLVRRKQGAISSWNNIQHRFRLAHDVNNDINRELNRAIDNAYRIRVGCSVAICVLGAAPLAAGTTIGLGVTTMSVTTGWMATAAVSGVYSLATEMIWSPADLSKAQVVAFHIDEGTKAGVVATGATAAQEGVTRAFKAKAQKEMQRAAGEFLAVQRNRVAAEGYRNMYAQRQADTAARYASRSKLAGKLAGGAAVVVGLYMMKDEIKNAFAGVTSGMDQTR
jgi:hypothetical protein